MTFSITRRLLVSNLIVLSAFLGLAGAALDRAFRSSVETATREELQAHVYTLLSAADTDDAGRMRLPPQLATPAFNQPDSGLYAEVDGENGQYRWRSASLLGRDRPLVVPVGPGTTRFRSLDGLLLFDFGILWEDDAGRPIPYVLTVARDRQPLDHQQSAFRTTLWRWLGGVAAMVLAVSLALLRWGLRPLHAMSDAVQRLETGQSTRIDGPVPRELRGLSNNLNALIDLNQQRQSRVRNSLADLAHSMKTPLAVLRSAADRPEAGRLGPLIDEQTERIDQIVSYQRQRAAVAGASAGLRPVALKPVLERLCGSLAKVHRERAVRCEIDLPDGVKVRVDQGDLFEMFGNLLENAFRHARRQVTVACDRVDGHWVIDVDDDGDGIDPADAARLLRRGERADERHPGEGIGLAVVSEIVTQYGGEIGIREADLGGARLRVTLPI